MERTLSTDYQLSLVSSSKIVIQERLITWLKNRIDIRWETLILCFLRILLEDASRKSRAWKNKADRSDALLFLKCDVKESMEDSKKKNKSNYDGVLLYWEMTIWWNVSTVLHKRSMLEQANPRTFLVKILREFLVKKLTQMVYCSKINRTNVREKRQSFLLFLRYPNCNLKSRKTFTEQANSEISWLKSLSIFWWGYKRGCSIS